MLFEIVEDDRSATKYVIFKMHCVYVTIFLYSSLKNQFCHTNSPYESIVPYEAKGAKNTKLHLPKRKLRPRIRVSMG